SLSASVERGFQGLEVPRAADQGNFRGRRYPCCQGRGALRRLGTESAKDVLPGGALSRVAAQQVLAERAKVVRDSLDEAGGVRRVEVLLLPQNLEECAAEGRPAGERLVEHRPERIPVAGGRHGAAGRLLRRHVSDRAQQVRSEAEVLPAPVEVGGQTK